VSPSSRNSFGGSPRLRTVVIARILLAGAVLLTAAGCDRGRGSDPDTLVLLYESDEWVLGPSNDDSPKFLVFLPLTDSNWRCRGRERWEAERGWPPPGIARSWERSADGRVWTVRLRDDVRWHDGTPVTAYDVAFSLDLWRDPAVGWYAGAPVSFVEVLDEHGVRFTLERPGDWPLQGWDVFLPRHLLEGLPREEFFTWDFWLRPVGNGPFRYVRHIPGVMIEFEANPEYPGERPGVDRLVLRLSSALPLTELLSGRVDVAPVSPLDALKLAGDSRFRLRFSASSTAVWLFWNLRRPPFDDPGVRRALAHAVDRRALHRALGYPEELPLTDGIYDWCAFHRGELADPLPHDPAEAVRLLEAAGWVEVDGSGVRFRDGRPLHFELVLEDRYLPAGVVLQDQLRRIGAAVALISAEQSIVNRRFLAGDFDAAIPRRSGLTELFGDGSPFGYRNPRVAELLRARRTAVEDGEREAIGRELGEITRAELPALFLFPRTTTWAARSRVHGLERLFESGNMMGVEHLRLEPEPR
jgi:peptide/nickel transport system substrate-binding protein